MLLGVVGSDRVCDVLREISVRELETCVCFFLYWWVWNFWGYLWCFYLCYGGVGDRCTKQMSVYLCTILQIIVINYIWRGSK